MKKLLTGLAMALVMAGACATTRAALITTNTYVAGTNNIWTNAVATFVPKTGWGVDTNIYTVATLPASAALFDQKKCSDCLTPDLPGSVVYWDGALWRCIDTKIQATTDMRTFLLSSLDVGWFGDGTMSSARVARNSVGTTAIDVLGAAYSSGAGAAISSITDANAYVNAITPGTTTTGAYAIYGPKWTPGNSWLLESVNVLAPAVQDGSDKWWSFVGQGQQIASAPVDGSGIYWDAYDALGYHPVHATNWFAVISKTGPSSAIVESGITIIANRKYKLTTICDGTNACYFYIDGTCFATNTANVSPNWQYSSVINMVKTTGTSLKYLYIYGAYRHTRWETSRGWPWADASARGLFAIGDSKTAATPGYVLPLTTLCVTNHLIESPPRLAVSGRTVATTLAALPNELASRSTNGVLYAVIDLGVNDTTDLADPTTWKANYGAILDAIHTWSPSVQCYLTRVWTSDGSLQAQWDTVDDTHIPAIIATRNTFCHLGVDERVELKGSDNGATETVDGIHPSVLGNARLAAAWKTLLGL